MKKMSLKAARVNKGYSQDKAAQLLDISPTTLRQWELGYTSPTIKKLQELIRLYDVTLDDLNL